MTKKSSLKTKIIKIVQRPAVGWFSLRMMVQAGIHALISATTDGRTARREVLAALDLAQTGKNTTYQPPPQPDEDGAIWLDYVADLGDGFNATYSIAWLLGRDYLAIGKTGKQVAQPIPADAMHEVPRDAFPTDATLLPAGSITVFGGDLVYPIASQEEYADRTLGPYHAARPWQDGPGRALFTIPGNHDWYDGLASFVRIFCQPKRWIGAWQVQQRRSYFSLQLGHGFWLWGVDLATSDDFDAPQLEYFADQADQLGENDQVILCVPKPAWSERDVKVNGRLATDEESWTSWSKIETVRDLVTKANHGASVPMVVAGDLHHYARHQAKDPTAQYITCGGGGAFMLGTSSVPQKVRLTGDQTAEKQAIFPPLEASNDMRSGVYKLFYRHKLFCLAMAAVQMGLVWFFQAASYDMQLPSGTIASGNYLQYTALGTLQEVIKTWDGLIGFWNVLLRILIYTPSLAVICFGVLLGFVAFARSGKGPCSPAWAPVVAGSVHFMVQICMAFLIAAILRELLDGIRPWLLLYMAVLTALTLFAGWFFCGLLFSTYLRIANLATGLHEQELYSSQSIEDWKCFLRMRVAEDGLTIYPIGLRRVARAWHPATMPSAVAPPRDLGHGALTKLLAPGTQFEVPNGATHLFDPANPLRPELIEAPIHIPSNPKGPA